MAQYIELTTEDWRLVPVSMMQELEWDTAYGWSAGGFPYSICCAPLGKMYDVE